MNRNISSIYYCRDCQSPFQQPLGRKSETISKKNGQSNPKFHNAVGPPTGMGEICSECGGKYHVRFFIVSSLIQSLLM